MDSSKRTRDDDSMEVEESGSGRIRGKKPKLDPLEKEKALDFIMTLVLAVWSNISPGAVMTKETVIDLNVSGVVAGIVSSIFNHIRKLSNPNSTYNTYILNKRDVIHKNKKFFGILL